MENSMSRILIETTVRQTLYGLKEDSRRSVRYLIDMALQFSQGRFQARFFETAQTWLKNENSAYYALVQDAVSHIETEHLVKLGMNVGYNSCTWGAQRIRDNEKRLGFNIPWTVLMQLDGEQFPRHKEQYQQAIAEGETLGIYAWMLFARNDPLELLPLAMAHPDSAFFFFCRAWAVTPALVDALSGVENLMPVVRLEEGAEKACSMLREARLPYSVFFRYAEKEAEAIVSGDLFYDVQQMHPLFTVLIPKADCGAASQREAVRAALEWRKSQQFQTLPWELYGDALRLDEIISDDGCCVFFDEEGELQIPGARKDAAHGNLFQEGLTKILQRTYPKPAAPQP